MSCPSDLQETDLLSHLSPGMPSSALKGTLEEYSTSMLSAVLWGLKFGHPHGGYP